MNYKILGLITLTLIFASTVFAATMVSTPILLPTYTSDLKGDL